MGRATLGFLLCFALAAAPRLGAAPAAAPSALPGSGSAPLTVTFTPSRPNGSLYQWQFTFVSGSPFVPDYTSEVDEDVSFTYQGPGTYTARLRVFDAVTGLADPDQDIPITVFPPPAPPAVTLTHLPFPTPSGATITFTATAVASPGRTITNYFWDLDNDGSVDVSSPGGPSATATSSFGPIGSYPVAVTATDNGGLANSAAIDVRISSDPVLAVAEPLSRLAIPGSPISFAASATATAPWSIASYTWDFGDGNGTTTAAGAASHAYAATGNYAVSVRATDTAGYFKTDGLGVSVQNPPAILLRQHYNQTNVSVMAYPPAGDSIVQYDWDLEDDTIFDLTTGTGLAAEGNLFTQGVNGPGVTVRAVFASSPPITASIGLTFAVMNPPPPPPTLPPPPVIALSASVDGSPFSAGPINTRVGHVVSINALAQSSDGVVPLTQILWDFDGDALRDRTDDLTALATPTANITSTYQYQTPGSYSVAVKVFEAGAEAEALLVVNVAPGSAPLECWIAQPRDGLRVWGNRVSIQARTAPAILTQSIEFQYRPSGSGLPWTMIGVAVPPPYSALSVNWDVTRLVPGDYDLRARATPTAGPPLADSEALQPIRVTVDPLAPDEEENGAAGGPIIRIHSVDPNVPTRSEIAKDTALEFPPHSLLARTTLRMERPFANPHPLEARLQGLQFVPGSFRRLSLGGGAALLQPTKISLYDTNPNGVLDGLKVDKAKLKIFQFDDVQKQWVPLFSQVSQPKEDLVRATLVSMGDVGLVVDPLSRAPSDSSSDGCAALGPEFLAFPAVLAFLRIRRRRA